MVRQLQSFGPTWHPIADSCRLLGEARHAGQRAAPRVGQYSWVRRSACSGIPGEPQCHVSADESVQILPPGVWSGSQTITLAGPRSVGADRQQPHLTPRLNGGPLYSWCCRVDGAKDEPKRERGSVLHPDGGPAGPVRPCWARRRPFRPENKHRQGGRYEPAPARFRISVDVFLKPQICVTICGVFFFAPPKFKKENTATLTGACDRSSEDENLSDVEWYWGSVSRSVIRHYGDNLEACLDHWSNWPICVQRRG